MPDQLDDLLGSAVADALRNWARGQGGTVTLPSQRWHSSGRTGAVLTAVLLTKPGPHGTGGATSKRIVKVLPAGMDREGGFHELAWQSDRSFAENHLARQTEPNYPVGDGRFLMFQEVAGDLVNYRSLGEIPRELWAGSCAAVTRLVLDIWNAAKWPAGPPVGRALVDDYLRWELRTPIGEIEDWAARQELARPDQAYLDGPGEALPNPIAMVLPRSSMSHVVVNYLRGLSHGDLHQGNVLGPHSEPLAGGPAQPWRPDSIRLIDLAGFDPAAPLTRDLVALSLSVAAAELRESPGADAREALQRALLDGGRPVATAEDHITATLRAMQSVAEIVPGEFHGEWRAQYLLSLLAGALVHTTYGDLGDPDRAWFFRLAAKAGAEFVRFARANGMIPTGPGAASRPDQILVAVVAATDDETTASELRDRLNRSAGAPASWTVYSIRPREENRVSSTVTLRTPDVLLDLLSYSSDVNVACRREVSAALSGRIPVITVRIGTVPLSRDRKGMALVELNPDDLGGVEDLIGRIAEVVSTSHAWERIEEDLLRVTEMGLSATGVERRRLDAYGRDRRVRQEDERRRAGSARHRDEPPIPDLAGTTVTARAVRLVNEAPGVPAGFRDRVEEMRRVESAIADDRVRLVVVTGDIGAGKSAFAAELRSRLASGDRAVPVDAVVYLSADGYRPITVTTVLSDLVESLADEAERQRLTERIVDPIEWPEKLTEVLAALGQTRVVVVLDGAEHLLNGNGDFRNQDLHRLLRQLATRSGLPTTLVMAMVDGPPRQLRAESDPPVRLVRLNRGLPFDDAMAFLLAADRGAVLGLAKLGDNDRHQMHALTRGHPRTLELLVGVLYQDPTCSVRDLLDELDKDGPEDAAATLFDRMFARLDRTEQRVVQALAVYARPVPHDAVDTLLQPFVPGIDSEPVLRGLHDRRIVRHDRGHYFLPAAESPRVLDGIPGGELNDHLRRQPPFTRHMLWRLAAAYFARNRPEKPTELQDLRPMLSEVDLRIRAWDYRQALELMQHLDDHFLRRWGHSDALVEWRRDITGRLGDPNWEAHNLTYLVAALQQGEDADGALTALGEARMQLPWHRSPRDRIRLELAMAKVQFEAGELTPAAQSFRRHLTLCRTVGGMPVEKMTSRLSLALCQARTGDFHRALPNFAAAYAFAGTRSGPEWDERIVLLCANYAWALGQVGETGPALDLLRKARSRAAADTSELGSGLCWNGEAAALIDAGRTREAIEPAEEAAKIAVRTRNPGLTRQANLNLALAQLRGGRLTDALATAEVSARLDRGPRAIGACGLLGLAAFRQADPEKARLAFSIAIRVANEQVNREGRDFQAHDALGLAYFGLAFIDFEQHSHFLREAARSYGRARTITSASGAVTRSIMLIDCLGADPDVTAAMRKVAASGSSTFD